MASRPKAMFSLSPVDFRTSAIAGRGVFAKRRFEPGDRIVAYAPKQRRIRSDDPEAPALATTKLTLATRDGWVIVPDSSVPGGWLCNHSCAPNAALFSDGEGRIECTRPIAPGEEVCIFYGWVTHGEPERDPCACGAPACRRFINFDISDEDLAAINLRDGQLTTPSDAVRDKLEEYAEFLRSIGQEHVQRSVANLVASLATSRVS